MTPTMLTPTEVEERFEDAARTLRRLPGVRVPGYFNTWPAVVRAAIEAYGYENAGAPIRISPTPQAITRMEETFTWLTWLSDPDDMRIVWLRAEGVRWKPICWRIGVSRPTAWRRWTAAMITIANRHNSALRNPVPKLSQNKMTAIDRNARRSAR